MWMSTIDSLADDIMAGLREYAELADDAMKNAVKKTATSVKKGNFSKRSEEKRRLCKKLESNENLGE